MVFPHDNGALSNFSLKLWWLTLTPNNVDASLRKSKHFLLLIPRVGLYTIIILLQYNYLCIVFIVVMPIFPAVLKLQHHNKRNHNLLQLWMRVCNLNWMRCEKAVYRKITVFLFSYHCEQHTKHKTNNAEYWDLQTIHIHNSFHLILVKCSHGVNFKNWELGIY